MKMKIVVLVASLMSSYAMLGQQKPDLEARLKAIEDQIRENDRKLNLILAYIRFSHVCQTLSNGKQITRPGSTLEEAKRLVLGACERESKSTKDQEACQTYLVCEKGLRS
jgi:hypothetical protein